MLEPGARKEGGADLQTQALMSIAISMKRIADALTPIDTISGEQVKGRAGLYWLIEDIMTNTRGAP
jgi:hypothetical protein